ncbi:MAG: HTH domain-containing protein [Tissierella sp.]|nr:HTH domain-containing protein [Tissierella sp.]
MPTIKRIIEEFVENNRYSYSHGLKNIDQIVNGSKEFSLLRQDEILKFLDRNIIKTTNKAVREEMGLCIEEAIESSFEKMKKLNDKAQGKEIYSNLVEYLNTNYQFNINIDELHDEVIGSPEERCVYILRETERANDSGEKRSLTEIASKLGCTTRTLQQDVKMMTEQGFRLLGRNIKLVDDWDEVLDMKSTPHPIVMIQNISQIMVMLEGLRNMESISAYRNYARSTAVNIWNQLTEYTQDRILDAIELLNRDSGDIIKWYLNLKREGQEHRSFQSEMSNSEENIINAKDCMIEGFDVGNDLVKLRFLDSVFELREEDIIEIDIL